MAKKSKHKRNRRLLAPRRLAEKLGQIRAALNFTQAEMVLIVNPFETETNRARISQYERNERIPSTVEIFNYARCFGISTDVLLDDALDLPSASGYAARNGGQSIPRAVIDAAPGQIRLNNEPPTSAVPTGKNVDCAEEADISIAAQQSLTDHRQIFRQAKEREKRQIEN